MSNARFVRDQGVSFTAKHPQATRQKAQAHFLQGGDDFGAVGTTHEAMDGVFADICYHCNSICLCFSHGGNRSCMDISALARLLEVDVVRCFARETDQRPVHTEPSPKLAAGLPSVRKEANGFTMFRIPNTKSSVPGFAPATPSSVCPQPDREQLGRIPFDRA